MSEGFKIYTILNNGGYYLKYKNKIFDSHTLRNVLSPNELYKFYRDFHCNFDEFFVINFETLEEAQRCADELNDKYIAMIEICK